MFSLSMLAQQILSFDCRDLLLILKQYLIFKLVQGKKLNKYKNRFFSLS